MEYDNNRIYDIMKEVIEKITLKTVYKKQSLIKERVEAVWDLKIKDEEFPLFLGAVIFLEVDIYGIERYYLRRDDEENILLITFYVIEFQENDYKNNTFKLETTFRYE